MSDFIRHAMRIPNSTAHLAAVRDVVNELVNRSAYPSKKDASVIMLAVDEAVANIMEHSYRDDLSGQREIEMELEADSRCFTIILRDSGTAFDPGKVEVPDLSEHVNEGHKHGLGLYLMRSVMDEVSYTFTEGVGNELRMVKLAKETAT